MKRTIHSGAGRRALKALAVLLSAALATTPLAAVESNELPLAGAAYRIAEQAYQAYAEGRYGFAAQRAREAVRLRPDVPRLHVLLEESLAAARRQADEAGREVAPARASRGVGGRAPSPPQNQRPYRAERLRPTAVATPSARTDRGRADSIDPDGTDLAAGLRLNMSWTLSTLPHVAAASLTTVAIPTSDGPSSAPTPERGAMQVQPANPNTNAQPLSPLDPGSTAPVTDNERAYAAIREGRAADAAAAFAHADQGGKLEPRHLQDAAYVSSDAGDAFASARYFRRALDAADAGMLEIEPQHRQDIRVAVADQERTWGGSAAAFYRGGATIPGLNVQGGSSDRSLQAVAEGYWRPGFAKGFAGGGSHIDLYGRVLGTPYSGAGYAENGASVQGALGVRAKPFSAINLVGGVERLVKIGSASRNDWLMRVALSDGFGMGPRLDRRPWWAGEVYAEAGRYARVDEKYLVTEARLGRSWRVDPESGWSGVSSSVLMLHGVLAADYNSGFPEPRAVSAGVGFNLRTWLREDNRSGPRSYLDFTVQARKRLSGDDRAGGLVLRLSYNH